MVVVGCVWNVSSLKCRSKTMVRNIFFYFYTYTSTSTDEDGLCMNDCYYSYSYFSPFSSLSKKNCFYFFPFLHLFELPFFFFSCGLKHLYLQGLIEVVNENNSKQTKQTKTTTTRSALVKTNQLTRTCFLSNREKRHSIEFAERAVV